MPGPGIGVRVAEHKSAHPEAELVETCKVGGERDSSFVEGLVELSLRADHRDGADEMGRMLHSRHELLLAERASSPGADLAVAPRLLCDPLDAVVAIEAASPLPAVDAAHRRLALEKAAPVHDDIGVTSAIEEGAEIGHAATSGLARVGGFGASRHKGAPHALAVVGRLDQHAGRLARLLRQIEIRCELLAITHRDLDRGVLLRDDCRAEAREHERVEHEVLEHSQIPCLCSASRPRRGGAACGGGWRG
jgi:hypothetical protein